MKTLCLFLAMGSVLVGYTQTRDSAASTRVQAGYGVHVEQTQPAFPGGPDSLRAFLKRNLHYPKEAMLQGVRGKVWLSFTVDTAGALKEPVVLKSVSPEIDSAATHILTLMPSWEPARIGDQAVEAQYLLQLEFIPPGQR
jgi:TonB family protein